jgi:hypothetical protein
MSKLSITAIKQDESYLNMGYCPYMCIVCENIEDNGWGYNCKNFKSYQKFLDNRNLLIDVKRYD